MNKISYWHYMEFFSLLNTTNCSLYKTFKSTSEQNGLSAKLIPVRPAIHFSYFVGISRTFSWNTSQNTKHSLYTFRISCEFRVLLMLWKNKPQNHLTFPANADWRKMLRNEKSKTRGAKHLVIHFWFFAFRDKCIASLRRGDKIPRLTQRFCTDTDSPHLRPYSQSDHN